MIAPTLLFLYTIGIVHGMVSLFINILMQVAKRPAAPSYVYEDEYYPRI